MIVVVYLTTVSIFRHSDRNMTVVILSFEN